MTGDSAMAEHIPGDPDAGSWFVRFDDGDMHLVQDGEPGAPAALLIHGTAASTASWDPVVPALAGACRVIRVDLAGHGRSAGPAGGDDISPPGPRAGGLPGPLGPGPVGVAPNFPGAPRPPAPASSV